MLYDNIEPMAPHCSTLAWKIPWMEEPGRLIQGVVKSWTRLSNFTFIFQFHTLEKEMATHSSILAWEIPRMKEPGELWSVGLQRAGQDQATSLSFFYTFPYSVSQFVYVLLLSCDFLFLISSLP